MTTPHLILASSSPRRQQLFHDLGLTFRALPADIDETPLPAEHPGAMTCRLAEEKARAVAAALGPVTAATLIVASDTTVALGATSYGKPLDAADAVRMLRDLRGGPHQVFSAISVLALPGDRQATRVNTTDVFMRDYSDAEIDAYVATGDPLDKAGAYGIQARDFACVSHLQGCYAGVMGLPLGDLAELLGEFGYAVTADVRAVCRQVNTFACCAADPAHSIDIVLDAG
jgi:MAF protein